MKNKGKIITLSVLLSIIIVLLVMFLIACLHGGINSKVKLFNISSKSTNVILEKKFELEDIKNIEVKQDAGDIIIKEAWIVMLLKIQNGVL